MSLQLSTPDQDGLAAAVAALRSWQHDVAPMQLHPGDLGWYERYGSQRAAAAVRTWSQDGQLLALAFLDEADLARLTTAPEVTRTRRWPPRSPPTWTTRPGACCPPGGPTWRHRTPTR